SHSPLEFSWRNSEQLQGDLVEAVTELKNDPAVRRVALSGSVSVVRQLFDAGLLDELHLFVHPATAGSGLKLFEDGGPARHFRLTSAQPFRTGVVHLVYAPDPDPPSGTYEEAKQDLPQD
ncbi:MAG: dihydrofolate reductase family protein, partial [Nocardioidaceae bacterium]